MVVIVCGGRDFSNREYVFSALDSMHGEERITLLRHGAARGADTLASEWAKSRRVSVDAHPADWEAHGRGAGHMRNQAMLDAVPRVDALMAFPGGRGTADMVARAERAGVRVVRCGW